MAVRRKVINEKIEKVDVEGHIEEVIEHLYCIADRLAEQGYTNLQITEEFVMSYRNYELFIIGDRMETDKELAARQKKEALDKANATKSKANRIAALKAELAKLEKAEKR